MKALLVDGLNLVRRIYAAVPDEAQANQSAQVHLDGVIASSTAALRRALKQHSPSHCLVVFDHGGRNWRHELFPDYKKNRKPMSDTLRDGMPKFEQAFSAVGVKCFSLSGYEADDVIATIAVKIARRGRDDEGGDVVILSTDRNYCQLLNGHVKVFDHFGQRYLDDEIILKRFNVKPQQLPDFLSLAGNSSASIPGVKSIGERTAAKLLHDYDTLENALLAADKIPGKLGSKLHGGAEDARMAKVLFTLKTDVDLGINLKELRYVGGEGG